MSRHGGQHRRDDGALDILYAGTLPPHTGGSAMLAGDLLAELACRGHRVRAVAPIVSTNAADAHAGTHQRVEVTRIVVPHFENSPDVFAAPTYREREQADIPAAREGVADGEDGLLFAAGDVADLTAKTRAATGDAALRARLGANAHATALTRPLPAMVAAYEAAFRSMLAS